MSRAAGLGVGRGVQEILATVTGAAMLCRAGASAAGQHGAATVRDALWWLPFVGDWCAGA